MFSQVSPGLPPSSATRSRAHIGADKPVVHGFQNWRVYDQAQLHVVLDEELAVAARLRVGSMWAGIEALLDLALGHGQVLQVKEGLLELGGSVRVDLGAMVELEEAKVLEGEQVGKHSVGQTVAVGQAELL